MLLLAIMVSGAAATLSWPMARDHGTFAWVGDVILHGGLPYTDAWEVKGPTTYLQSAATQAVFGRNMWGVRLVSLAIMAAAGWAAYVLAAEIAGAGAGLWGVIFLLALHVRLGYWHTAQPDAWAAMLGLVAIALVWRSRWPAWTRASVAGLILGWITLYKPPIYAIFPLLLFAAILLRRDEGVSPHERKVLASSLVAGTLVSAGGVLLWLGLRGGLDDAWDILVVFNSKVYMQEQQITVRWIRSFLKHVVRYEHVLAFAGLAWLYTRDRALAALLLGWMAAGMLMILLQMKMYAYHWTIIHGVVAVGAGIATTAALRYFGGREDEEELRAQWSPTAVLLILLAILVLVPRTVWMVEHAAKLAQPLMTGDMTAYYYDPMFGGPGDACTGANLEVATYLRQHTRPSDTVMVWGFEPIVNYLSGRLPPTKYGFRYPITAALDRAPELGRAILDELMSGLRTDPPEYFVVVDNDLNSLHRQSSRERLQEIPELATFVSDNYVPDTRIEDFELWRLRDTSGADQAK